MNTHIELMYRDACNWKSYIDFVIDGEIAMEQIQPYLQDGEFLIPFDAGLPEVQIDDPNPEIDHPFYTIATIEHTRDAPTIALTADALRRNFETVQWDEQAAMERIFGK